MHRNIIGKQFIMSIINGVLITYSRSLSIIFLKDNYFKLADLRKNKRINILIDVTKIPNKFGSEGIGIDCENKKKNVTALSVAIDETKIPLGAKSVKTNLNKTKSGRNTIKHDITAVQATLDAIPFTVKPYIKINVIGDKGYISSNKFKVMDREVLIIAPKRKNQKKRNTKREKTQLAKRYKIENYNAYIKRKDRVRTRKDRSIKNYMSFVYITFLECLCDRMKKTIYYEY